MKIKYTSLLAGLALLATVNCAKAQSMSAGTTLIGLGVGYSNFTPYLNGAQPTLELPELSATVDYFVIKNYSIGLGVAYQSATGNGYYNNYNYPPTQTGSYTESVGRTNVSVRSVVYFSNVDLSKDMKVGFYAGICLGYEYFNYSYSPFNPNTINPNYYSTQPLTAPTIQAFVGARARITEGFSTYFELGSGLPFYAEMGFSINFGGKPEVAAQPANNPSGPLPYAH